MKKAIISVLLVFIVSSAAACSNTGKLSGPPADTSFNNGEVIVEPEVSVAEDTAGDTEGVSAAEDITGDTEEASGAEKTAAEEAGGNRDGNVPAQYEIGDIILMSEKFYQCPYIGCP